MTMTQITNVLSNFSRLGNYQQITTFGEDTSPWWQRKCIQQRV